MREDRAKTIKPSVIGALQRYVEHRIPTGDFLYAVLCNDLRRAFVRADDENRETLYEIVDYCYRNLPRECWGSQQKVTSWLSSNNKH